MRDIVGLASENLAPSAFEAAVLELLNAEIGFDVAYFSVIGAERQPTAAGLDAEHVDRAVQRAPRYLRDLLPVKRAALGARCVAVDTQVLGEHRVRETAYHRELGRAVGGRHSLMAYVPLRGRIVAAVMLGRSGSCFSANNIERVESLLPGLGMARGSYGLPLTHAPLDVPKPTDLLSRLGGIVQKTRVLASARIGDRTVTVRDRDGFREMVEVESGRELVWTRANIRDPSESGWPYIELLHLAAVHAKSRRRALFIGCGGAVALRQFASLYPGLMMDLVEREPLVIDLARAWYDLDKIPGLRVHIGDGADFVKHAPPTSWDIAVIDAFDASAPESSMTEREFFAGLRMLLGPGSAVAINVIGTLAGPGPVRDVINGLGKEFERVRVVPVMETDEVYSPDALRNVVLIASKSA